MKLIFENLKDTPLNILRHLGYAFLKRDERTGEMSFVRKMSGGDYPRFHIFVKQDKEGSISLNLHLDQKKPSYQGSAAHSGEYEDSAVVQKEAERVEKEFKL